MRKLDIEATAHAIEEWVVECLRQSRRNMVAIGISGGIDSAVVAALCVRAIGYERVHGLILPCQSSSRDVDHAQNLCRRMRISYLTLSLDFIFNSFIAQYAASLGALAQANLKSRLRMSAIYLHANHHNSLVVGTTNLTEMYLGYFTKYGDGGIDIEPIASLLKREVREMAGFLDVPEEIIAKPPSAGLWEGQTDEAELGYTYEQLDEAVHKIVCGRKPTEESPAVDKFVWQRFAETDHKRVMPPQFLTPVIVA